MATKSMATDAARLSRIKRLVDRRHCLGVTDASYLVDSIPFLLKRSEQCAMALESPAPQSVARAAQVMVDEVPSGTVLRYHGGKARLAEWIISHFPTHRVYVEPYGGGASVLMRKPRSKAEVYNELDRQVANVFEVLRDPEQNERLCELIVLTPFSREQFDLSYEESEDPVEQARRTIMRGFMGMSTRGTSGAHRTGFRYSDTSGSRAEAVWARYPDRIAAFGRRLSGVIIDNVPAVDLIKRMDGLRDGPETLYYCDPRARCSRGGCHQRQF